MKQIYIDNLNGRIDEILFYALDDECRQQDSKVVIMIESRRVLCITCSSQA